MPVDPTITDGQNFLGVKVATVVAGFMGGVVCLSYLRELTKLQAAGAVLIGAITASYGTPALMYYIHMPPPLENFAAFFIGLTAMNIIPGLIKISDVFRRNPAGFIGRKGESE